jgi:hypothetical protein
MIVNTGIRTQVYRFKVCCADHLHHIDMRSVAPAWLRPLPALYSMQSQTNGAHIRRLRMCDVLPPRTRLDRMKLLMDQVCSRGYVSVSRFVCKIDGASFYKTSTAMRFELTHPKDNNLAGYRLNHSATLSHCEHRIFSFPIYPSHNRRFGAKYFCTSRESNPGLLDGNEKFYH